MTEELVEDVVSRGPNRGAVTLYRYREETQDWSNVQDTGSVISDLASDSETVSLASETDPDDDPILELNDRVRHTDSEASVSAVERPVDAMEQLAAAMAQLAQAQTSAQAREERRAEREERRLELERAQRQEQEQRRAEQEERLAVVMGNLARRNTSKKDLMTPWKDSDDIEAYLGTFE